MTYDACCYCRGVKSTSRRPSILKYFKSCLHRLWNQRINHVREEPMQLYHRYRQSDHTREDSVNEKAILSSAATRELLLADML